MKSVIKAIDLLDENGFYKLADQFESHLIKLAAWPYNLTSLDQLPLSARYYTWKNNDRDFKEFDEKFWKELKQRIPDYRSLNTDQSDEGTLESAMHGPDPVSGPARVEPTQMASSPSMNGSLDYFEWDVAHPDSPAGFEDEIMKLKPRG